MAAEYVKRLLKGKVKLKDKQQQHKASLVVKDNAESLHKLFSRMVRIQTGAAGSMKISEMEVLTCDHFQRKQNKLGFLSGSC